MSVVFRSAWSFLAAAALVGCSANGLSSIPAQAGPSNGVSGAAGRVSQTVVDNSRAFPPTHGPLFYISDQEHSVIDVFRSSGEYVGQIWNKVFEPAGIVTDAKGNLWVTDSNNTVQVYARGASSPTKTLADPAGGPIDVAVCSDGTAIVANFYDIKTDTGSIQVYPPEALKPGRVLNYPHNWRTMYVACDAQGNVFAEIITHDICPPSGECVPYHVLEFPHGNQQGARNLGIKTGFPGGVKADAAGNILIADNFANTIAEYTENGVATGKSFNLGPGILGFGPGLFGFAISPDDRQIYAAAQNVDKGLRYDFATGKIEHAYYCCPFVNLPLGLPYGAAFDPGQGHR
jgi:DNA-binding beta-propeller fold protein YncE